ncbi:MAG: protein phosphatase 2C domain-containing protein [Solirubrobacterales bacterium]|nr:protein phosphatase 2C domain-containing protein [Solirubrobacterales bacterium]
MASFERQRSAGRANDGTRPDRPLRLPRAAVLGRPARLARGPLTIGDPAPAVEVRLAAAEPYRPDSIADGGSTFGLTARAASVRGLYKRYLGGPRQDDLCLGLHEPSRTLIAAVADGVSSAPRSHLGAALAVRHAAAAVARQLDDGVDELRWEEVFKHAAWALVDEQRRADGGADAGVEAAAASLATTLVVAAITAAPSETGGDGNGDPAEDERTPRVQLAAVGDSPAFLLGDGAFKAIAGGFDSPDALLGGGVQALPRSTRPAYEDARMLEPGQALLLCTDGLALPLAGGASEVGPIFARELSSPPDVLDFARLLDFSRSTYDDDRTLVAVWCQP